MNNTEKQNRLEAFEKSCRVNGIPCTVQRHAILEAVLDSTAHPSANQIYQAVKIVHREISRATVHRNLDILTGMGLITKTCHPGGLARYDARIDIHHHLICLHCNSIIDIDDDNLNALDIPDTSVYDFEVSDFHVQLRGCCRNCKKKESLHPKRG